MSYYESRNWVSESLSICSLEIGRVSCRARLEQDLTNGPANTLHCKRGWPYSVRRVSWQQELGEVNWRACASPGWAEPGRATGTHLRKHQMAKSGGVRTDCVRKAILVPCYWRSTVSVRNAIWKPEVWPCRWPPGFNVYIAPAQHAPSPFYFFFWGGGDCVSSIGCSSDKFIKMPPPLLNPRKPILHSPWNLNLKQSHIRTE